MKPQKSETNQNSHRLFVVNMYTISENQHEKPFSSSTKKMAKIKPMMQPSSVDESNSQLVKIRTPIRAVWRHKPIVYRLESDCNVEHVFINSDSYLDDNDDDECSKKNDQHHQETSIISLSPDSTEGGDTANNSALFISSPTPPSSSTSFIIKPQSISINQSKKETIQDCTESESDYIVIHNNQHFDCNRRVQESRNTMADAEYSDDPFDEEEFDCHIDTIPDDLCSLDDDDLYRNKRMATYFMEEIGGQCDNNQMEGDYCLNDHEPCRFDSPSSNESTHRQLVYDFPDFIPSFGYGFLETIIEENEDDFDHRSFVSLSDDCNAIHLCGDDVSKSYSPDEDDDYGDDDVFNGNDGTMEKQSMSKNGSFQKRSILDSGIRSQSSAESIASTILYNNQNNNNNINIYGQSSPIIPTNGSEIIPHYELIKPEQNGNYRFEIEFK